MCSARTALPKRRWSMRSPTAAATPTLSRRSPSTCRLRANWRLSSALPSWRDRRRCSSGRDYSAIEARIDPWLAMSPDADRVLDIFRANDADPTRPDIYMITAADILHKNDPSGVTKSERNIGKVATLALGFGGSVGALKAMALNYRIHLDDAEARRIVDAWREANPWAREFWNALWDAAMTAWEVPGQITTAGRIAFVYRDDYLGGSLFMALPSGRLLTYPRPRWREVDILDRAASRPGRSDVNVRSDAPMVAPSYGTARSVKMRCRPLPPTCCAQRSPRIETNPALAFMPIRMTTHDEIVCEVVESRADEAKAILRREMLTLPAWAEGLPLQSEEIHLSVLHKIQSCAPEVSRDRRRARRRARTAAVPAGRGWCGAMLRSAAPQRARQAAIRQRGRAPEGALRVAGDDGSIRRAMLSRDRAGSAPSGYLFLWADAFRVGSGDHLRVADVLSCVDLIAWNNGRFGMGYRTRRCGDYLVILQKPPIRAKATWHDHGIRDRWIEEVDALWVEKVDTDIHPHIKPAGLIRRLIAAVTAPGDLVIDPAAGSFTVMDVAHELGRRFCGCDIAEVFQVNAPLPRVLRGYQQRAATYLYESDSAFLIAPLGAGKGAAALTGIAELIRDGQRRHALVIAPKLVATTVWPAEVAAWPHLAHLGIAVLDGNLERRRELLAAVAERQVTVIGVDLVPWLVDELAEFAHDHPIFDMLVIDETSRLKDPSGKRARALLKIAGRFRTRWGLTGTPRPIPAWTFSCRPPSSPTGRLWGRAFVPWQKRHFRPRDPFGREWIALPGAEERIAAEFGTVAMTVSDDDMPDLPPLNIVVTRVKLPDAVMATYQTMQRELFAAIEERSIEAVSPLVATGKCAQLANGFLYDEGNEDTVEVHTVKIEWLRELVESLNGEPLLVAYEFLEDLRAIRRAFGDVPALGGLTPAGECDEAGRDLECGNAAAAGLSPGVRRSRNQPAVWRSAHGVAVAVVERRTHRAGDRANLPAGTDAAHDDSRLRRRRHRRRDEAQPGARQDVGTGSVPTTSGAGVMTLAISRNRAAADRRPIEGELQCISTPKAMSTRSRSSRGRSSSRT